MRIGPPTKRTSVDQVFATLFPSSIVRVVALGHRGLGRIREGTGEFRIVRLRALVDESPIVASVEPWILREKASCRGYVSADCGLNPH